MCVLRRLHVLLLQVWPQGVSRVTAVEPSAAMSQLGRRLEAARRFSHPHTPLVRHARLGGPHSLGGSYTAWATQHSLVHTAWVWVTQPVAKVPAVSVAPHCTRPTVCWLRPCLPCHRLRQVRWRPDMPPAARSARKKQQQAQQSYDLVVASYMLGELHSPQERAALVRRLWGEHQAHALCVCASDQYTRAKA